VSTCGWGIRVGDLAQPGENLTELSHAALADVLGPLVFDLRDDGRCKRQRLAATFGDPYQTCAGIGGVGNALYIAGPLQLIDQEACGLLGDGRLLGKVGEPTAARRDALKDACLKSS
jgi:hypothetical protein